MLLTNNLITLFNVTRQSIFYTSRPGISAIYRRWLYIQSKPTGLHKLENIKRIRNSIMLNLICSIFQQHTSL